MFFRSTFILLVWISGCGIVFGAITKGALYQVWNSSPTSGTNSPTPVSACSVTYCARSCMDQGTSCPYFAFKVSSALVPASCDRPGLCQVRSSNTSAPDSTYAIYKQIRTY